MRRSFSILVRLVGVWCCILGVALGEASAQTARTYKLDKVDIIPAKVKANPKERAETVQLSSDRIIVKLFPGKGVWQLDVRISGMPKAVEEHKLYQLRVVARVSILEAGKHIPPFPKILAKSSGSVHGLSLDDQVEVLDSDRSFEPEFYLEGSEGGDAELVIRWEPFGFPDESLTWEGGIRWHFSVGAAEPEEKLPVVFIPGVCGSILETDTAVGGSQLWPLEFNPFADRRLLAMDSSGTKSQVAIKATDVIRSAAGKDFYGTFLDALKSWGYKEGDNLAVFPYDWRLSNHRQLQALNNLIDAVLERTGKKKVIFVTHSMGGIVARTYLKLRGPAKVAKHIAVSMPNFGSPKVYFAYIMGYTFGNDSVNPNTLKFLFPNWAAGYQIMPWRPFVQEGPLGRQWSLAEALAVSYRSVTHVATNVVRPDTWEISPDFPWKFNEALYKEAWELQGALGDLVVAGVDTHSIIGYGLATISGYETLDAKAVGRTGAVKTPGGVALNMIPRFMTGDETVPLWSLEGLKGDKKYYLRNEEGSSAEHTYIIQSQRAQRIVKGILDGKVRGPADLPDLDLKGPTEEERRPTGKGPAEMTIMCPADLHVYDAQGRHLGPSGPTTSEARIPSSSFFKGPDDQFAAILLPTGAYRIKIVATGEGEFTFIVSLGEGADRREVRYSHVPITKDSVAETEFPSMDQEVRKPSELRVTTNGQTKVYPGEVVPIGGPPPIGGIEGPPKNENPPVRAEPGAGGKEPVGPKKRVLGSSSAGWTHTFAYHQLSLFGKADALEVYNGQEPRISDSGNRIVFSCSPSKDDPKGRSRVGVVDFDGGNLKFVDTTSSPPMVDISGDGSVIASVDNSELRVTKLGEPTKVLLEDRGLGGVRVSRDGKRIYFTQSSDYVYPGTNMRLQRGVYITNIDGSGMRKLAGASEVAPMIGVPPESVGTFYGGSRGAAMDVSANGRVVFLVKARTASGNGHLFTVESDGSNLRRVVGPMGELLSVGISSDGQTIGWVATQPGVEGYQGWIADADGTSARQLTNYGDAGRSVSLSEDGSKVVFGWDAKQYFADGSEPVPLYCQGSSLSSHRFGELRLTALVMSADGQRFLYAMNDSASYQIAVIEKDPVDAPEAPLFEAMELGAPGAIAGRRPVRATLKSSPDLLGGRMVLQFFKDGKELYPMGLGALLCDDGKSNGDLAAADGIYTDAGVSIDKSVPPPWKLRVRAERVDSSGRHHGLVVEARIGAP